MIESKACKNCNQIKELSFFKKEKRAASGVASICSKCHAVKVAAYRLANPEKVKASQKATYDKYTAKRVANSQKWASNNASRRKKIEAKYRASHRQEVQERSEKWRLSNPNKPKEYKLRRRVRLEKNGEFVILTREINRLYSSPCFYCGGLGRIEADHLIPVSKGGRHSIGNLVPACRSCNASKGNRFITEWKHAC
jgi:5-methylcytosine-specific restriction endonuclease McrA